MSPDKTFIESIEAGSVREAERLFDAAEHVIHQGHNGYGTDERGAYGQIATAQAVLSLCAEVRALRLQVGDALERLADVAEAYREDIV